VNRTRLIICGGFAGNGVYLNTCEALELLNQQAGWQAIAPMSFSRHLTSGILLPDGNSFLMAGGVNVLPCEILNIAANKWTTVASLPFTREWPRIVNFNNRIVIIGGWNNIRGQLKTCEEYHVGNNSWSSFPSLILARERFGAAVVQGRIYIAGGFNGTAIFSSVEVFDGLSWSFLNSGLASKRIQLAAVSFQNKFVVLGGDGATAVEVYDPVTAKWSSNTIPLMKVAPFRKDHTALSF